MNLKLQVIKESGDSKADQLSDNDSQNMMRIIKLVAQSYKHGKWCCAPWCSLPIVFSEIDLRQPLICKVPEIEPHETLGFWYCISHQTQLKPIGEAQFYIGENC
ncbi:uncharacterized protein LOC115991773 [Quercus lobata]|uniref:uncharacterized protein LOC115991773 n=1 Tax=Quercus lobata TaxID=97700 RepID=UPI001248AE8E|nr:uncharacterized protein LOC115991773 [Quercus lobata]